jgi:hypothetical protein
MITKTSTTTPATTSATGIVPPARRHRHGLAQWEVSAMKNAAQTMPGQWTATPFDCECCGRTVVRVAPTCEEVAGPSFEVSRYDRRIVATTTWLLIFSEI